MNEKVSQKSPILHLHFSKKLELICRQMLTQEKLVQFGKYLFHRIKSDLLNDKGLFLSWIACIIDSRGNVVPDENGDLNISQILNGMITSFEVYI